MDKTATFNERQTVAAHTQTLFAWAAQACATPLPPPHTATGRNHLGR